MGDASIFGRRDALMLAEEAGEIGMRLEAQILGDMDQRRFGVYQHHRRLLHAQRIEEEAGGQACYPFELIEEMRPGEAGDPRELGDVEPLSDLAAHRVDGPPNTVVGDACRRAFAAQHHAVGEAVDHADHQIEHGLLRVMGRKHLPKQHLRAEIARPVEDLPIEADAGPGKKL